MVEFDFSGPRAARVWLVLERSEPSVCVTPPRFDPDLVLHADLNYFYQVWYGRIEWAAALRCGAITFEGRPALARQFPRWLLWSPMRRFVERRTDRGDAGTASSTRRAAIARSGRG